VTRETISLSLRRRTLALHRKLREARMIWRGLRDTEHPVLAHIIPIRRCNIACAYCNEYDQVSPPVPTAEMIRRIDRLAGLGLSVITLSGGEPLLHPELDELIRHVRRRGIIASLITNGYLLGAERIKRLNDAGLEYMQISIDNIEPDETSMKSLKVLENKLLLLAGYAEFDVNINSVIGAGVERPEDAYTIARRARDLGFTSTVGIIHDGSGQLRPLTDSERNVYEKIKALGKRSYSRIDQFQKNIAQGKPNNWRCRAGGRYVYVCEDGLVHYCSQQRGYPGIPLEQYTVEHVRTAYHTEKDCAPRCTISCVHKVSVMDFWRDPQTLKAPALKATPLVQLQTGGD
jgi:MoaA/NifB/PqqE/SkfB family radical SAM enzyme